MHLRSREYPDCERFTEADLIASNFVPNETICTEASHRIPLIGKSCEMALPRLGF